MLEGCGCLMGLGHGWLDVAGAGWPRVMLAVRSVYILELDTMARRCFSSFTDV